MKGETPSSTIYILFVFLTFFVTLSTAAKLAGGAACGGTVCDCMETTAGGESEFLMDSETSRRLLLGDAKQKTHIIYNPLKRAPICDAHRYANCIEAKKNGKINCAFDNRSCS